MGKTVAIVTCNICILAMKDNRMIAYTLSLDIPSAAVNTAVVKHLSHTTILPFHHESIVHTFP